jgi:predicted CXXCH cytochrome family protein
MGCHKYPLTLRFTDGDEQTLLIDPEKVSESVHADHDCIDCHAEFSADEHPANAYASKRELTLGMADACKECHFDKYTRTLESIHYDLISKGDLRAPGCVDCHGAHEIAAGQVEKISSARRCRTCHEKIYDVYAKSVHGSALVADGNRDVPVCADCHEAHSIHDPRTVSFHNQTPELCASCHADTELMARYGLSAAVLSSYLEDFHGVTLTFYKAEGESGRHIAVCTDCHGIHDINSMHDADAAGVKARLLERCRRCHPDAAESFPDSWVSHYEPSLSRAPLVFLVDLGYKIFIPFMLVGLVLQILLHVWRHSVKR